MICPKCKQELDNIESSPFCPFCGYEFVKGYFDEDESAKTDIKSDAPRKKKYYWRKKELNDPKAIKKELFICIGEMLCLIGVLSFMIYTGTFELLKIHQIWGIILFFPVIILIYLSEIISWIKLLKKLKIKK
ncbi:MAG: hypothetical protein MJ231_01355 [bacterium]|nr:hypothetical protein [bacterium]